MIRIVRTVTVSHNWYSFPRCSGTAIPTVFGVLSNVLCRDWGRTCWAWSGLVRMKSELGHSLTHPCMGDLLFHAYSAHIHYGLSHFVSFCWVVPTLFSFRLLLTFWQCSHASQPCRSCHIKVICIPACNSLPNPTSTVPTTSSTQMPCLIIPVRTRQCVYVWVQGTSCSRSLIRHW